MAVNSPSQSIHYLSDLSIEDRSTRVHEITDRVLKVRFNLSWSGSLFVTHLKSIQANRHRHVLGTPVCKTAVRLTSKNVQLCKTDTMSRFLCVTIIFRKIRALKI